MIEKHLSKIATNKLVHNEINYLILFGVGRFTAGKFVELSIYYAKKIEAKGL